MGVTMLRINASDIKSPKSDIKSLERLKRVIYKLYSSISIFLNIPGTVFSMF